MLHVQSGFSAALLAALATLVTACASQMEHDEEVTARPSCPRDLKLECYEREGRETKCRCVSSGEMQEMIEDLSNFEFR